MENRYIVAVGGTGQHLALALARLRMMGALRDDLKLITIDPDNRTALPLTLEAPAGLRGDMHPLKGGPVFAPFDVTKIGAAPFERLFLDPDHPREAELFEMMFDSKAASIPISKGMYGTPCVGATVFAEGANGETLKSLLKPLANASRVFVCGSVIGGTGAGIIHKLIGEIRRYFTREIFGIFMLPWFSVSESGAQGAISPALIDRNAKHGLKYFYEHTIPNLTASLLLGYPGSERTSVLRPLTVTAGQMGEYPHYLHLAAARGLTLLPDAHTAQRSIKAYGMVHDRVNEGWLLDATWEHTSASLRLLARAQRVLLSLLQFILAEANKKKLLAYYEAGKVKRATVYAGMADAWGSLHDSILNAQGAVEQQGEFTSQMLSELDQIAREVRFCVDWLSSIFPEGTLNLREDPLMDLLRKGAEAGSESPIYWPKIAEIWRGGALPSNLSMRNTPARVARHHADLIFHHGLKI